MLLSCKTPDKNILPYLITHHAERQNRIDDGYRNDHCVGNQPFVLSEFLPANQVALRIKKDGLKQNLSK